jgi:hypothetical protein
MQMRNAVLLPILLVFTASAQDAMFGFGVGLEKTIIQVRGGDNTTGMTSVDVLPVDFTTFSIPVLIRGGQARVEPEIGFVRSASSIESSTSTSDFESSYSVLQLGLGLSGGKRVENLLYTFGIKAGMVRLASYSKSTATKYERSQTNFHFGPVFGVEYFLVPKLSIGAQIGVSYINIGDMVVKEDDPLAVDDDSVDQYLIGNSGKIDLRWYY